ncbi:alpha/beta hydrolase [Sphingobacterium sp. JB170]|uniref:alpha/beta hydrolase n=1 Tax=Sphingobacterium sp. JB170 TaxID=1434842 RepID=UPI00097EC168|nr:alpha/beta hydrolase [Sphingobacterium sp. JB170]SJN50085.1 endo-1,4-beta-xylanase B [Sphingobacterium sp. JB170]
MKFLYTFLFVVLINYYTLAQEKVALYSTVPNTNVESLPPEDVPVLYLYEKPGNDKAVLVIPGGGYAHVAIDHEGHAVAKEFNKHGYNAYVLYYRLPKDGTMVDRKIGPLQDAERAMQLIREKHPYKEVGVIGFSAGGHLAATLSNHYDDVEIKNESKTSLRPDFSALIYPVISMDDAITHQGSKTNLLGQQPTQDVELYYSLEKQVNKQTPVTFLVHAEDDKAVPIENSLRYKAALEENGISNQFEIYETGGHGFGLINKTDPKSWSDSLFKWLDKQK